MHIIRLEQLDNVPFRPPRFCFLLLPRRRGSSAEDWRFPRVLASSVERCCFWPSSDEDSLCISSLLCCVETSIIFSTDVEPVLVLPSFAKSSLPKLTRTTSLNGEALVLLFTRLDNCEIGGRISTPLPLLIRETSSELRESLPSDTSFLPSQWSSLKSGHKSRLISSWFNVNQTD